MNRYIFCAHRANSRGCLRRCLAFGYVARCCSRRNARLSCGADNGGRNTFPHTISPFTPFNSVLLRSGAFRFLKPDCVAWLVFRYSYIQTIDKGCCSPFQGFATAPFISRCEIVSVENLRRSDCFTTFETLIDFVFFTVKCR